ncbi:MAG: hypothetical protein Q9227_000719 [Pyrenula ochraceoflavens]
MSATASGSNPQPNGSAKSRDHNQGNQEKKYTIEQKTAVLRVKRCKADAFYEILAIEKTASDGEIKKAYRKLSLLTHPDKNGYDGADEAFKMVSRAFQVLSDPDKKSRFDQFGGDPDNRFSSSGSAGASASPFSGFSRSPGAGRGFDEEISPEELFNRFFGGGGAFDPFGGMGGGQQFVFNFGGGPGFRVHQFGGTRPRRRPREANGGEGESAPSGFSALVQLLPILILFILPLLSSLFSGSGTTGPQFRFDGAVKPHTLHRVTPDLNVDYWIDPREVKDFNKGKFQKLDARVESEYVGDLQYRCRTEYNQQQQMIYDAQGLFWTDQVMMERARGLPLDSCKKLDKLKIRNKRLAKLAQQSQQRAQENGDQEQKGSHDVPIATSPPAASPPKSPTAEAPLPSINITKIPQPSSPPAPPQPQQSNGPNIQIRPLTPQKREPQESLGRPSSRSGDMNIETWEDKTLKNAFRITIDPEQTRDVHGHPLRYLEGLRQEIEGTKLAVKDLEQAIVEAASNLPPKTTPLDYLLGCWKRLSRLQRSFKKPNVDDRKWQIVQESRRLCLSWSIFAITTPELFGIEQPATNPLAKHLLLDPEDDSGICHDFLTEAVARFSEDESVKDALVGAVEEMSRQVARKSMDSDYRTYTGVLRNLVNYKPLAHAITQSSVFCDSSVPAANIESSTLLGPYFALSPLQAETTKQYFANPKTLDPNRIVDSQRSLRMALSAHQADLLGIVNMLVRASTDAKEKVLDWFAMTVNSNHKRRAMQVDKSTVSSDGFMINVTVILDQLCEPFMDAAFSKIDKIDINYLQRQSRVNMKDETKINADQQASDAFYGKSVGGTSNFITEIFFLTVAAHHYGTEGANSALQELEKELKHMQKQLDKFETERHRYVNNPTQLQMFERALEKYRDQVEKGHMYKLALTGVLLDETAQTRSMQFMRYVIVFLLRLVSPNGNFPKQKFELPLPETEPDTFKMLPEYFLEDINSNFSFILTNLPHVISSTQSDELVMLCITFLRNSEYIKNPHLKSGLVTILFRGTWPWRRGGVGVLADLFNGLPFATKYLLHSLMKFFIEAEFTGGHAQFFDKFTIRFEIFQIIKCIWPNHVYRDNLSREAKQSVEFFVRFVNLLLNDTTFVLDESFTSFKKIFDLQTLLETNPPTDQAIRQEKEEELAGQQRTAKSYMQLANETVAMLNLFTEALDNSFTMPEIVQRLVDMLDYNLEAMVGPKARNLNVRKLDTYGFNPKALLAELVSVYLNLRAKPNFILAVARDGRSYRPANFDKASQILRRHMLKSPQEMQQWEKLKKDVAAAKAEDDEAEQDLGEIPDEFLDPLMFTLMEDPVVLPTSKTTLDRSTIRSHLLSDPNDPFNRVPLSIEDVVPNTELKAKIEAFKTEKKAGKREFEQNQQDKDVNTVTTTGDTTGNGDSMDTTP